MRGMDMSGVRMCRDEDGHAGGYQVSGIMIVRGIAMLGV